MSFLIEIGLFGEGPAERRERLRKLVAELGESVIQRKKEQKKEEQKRRDEVMIHLSVCLFAIPAVFRPEGASLFYVKRKIKHLFKWKLKLQICMAWLFSLSLSKNFLRLLLLRNIHFLTFDCTELFPCLFSNELFWCCLCFGFFFLFFLYSVGGAFKESIVISWLLISQ